MQNRFANHTFEGVLAGLLGPNAAHALGNSYSDFTSLCRATDYEILALPNVGSARLAQLRAAFEMASRVSREALGENPLLDTPEAVANLLREEARGYATETFKVVLLNTRRRLIRAYEIATGTLDTILVHPREVFKHAIAANAAALVLSHNHPSGDPTPSEADIKVTRDMIRAGQLLRIEVLDHVILGTKTADRQRDFASLRELGYFYS